MTNTYAPRLTPLELLNSIHYWVNALNTWAPGIAFPSGPNVPPNDENAHNNDFFYETDRNRLWRHDGDGSSGSWIDLGEAANAIQNCGTSLPPSGSEGTLFNKYNTGEIYQWIGNDPGSWRNIGSNKYGLPLGVDALTFTDITNPEQLSAKLGLVLVDGNSPILATDQGFVVKKDLSAGGFIATNQGEVWIGHGRDYATDVPKIILDHAGIGYPTLYLRQRLWDSEIDDWSVTTPAHLDVGNLTVHGDITVVGSLVSLADHLAGIVDSSLHIVGGLLGFNPARAPTFAGMTLNGALTVNAPTSTGITLGGGTIYWQTATTPDVLEMNCGLIVDGALNAAGASINGQLGVTGRITSSIATGTAPLSVTSTTMCSNLNADKLDGYDASSFLLASNQYITSVTSPLQVASKVLSIQQATSSQSGYLSSTDWNTFNNKYGSGSNPSFSGLTISGNANISGYTRFNNDARLTWVATSTLAVQDSGGSTTNGALDAGSIYINNLLPLNSGSPAGININCPLSIGGGRGISGQVLTSNGSGSSPTWQPQQWTAGTVTSISAPLRITSNALNVPQANSSTNGYLSSGDWNAFNNKVPYSSGYGTVSSGINIGSGAIYWAPSISQLECDNNFTFGSGTTIHAYDIVVNHELSVGNYLYMGPYEIRHSVNAYNDWDVLGGHSFIIANTQNGENQRAFEIICQTQSFGYGQGQFPVLFMKYWHDGSPSNIFEFVMNGTMYYLGQLLHFDFMDDIAAIRNIKTKIDVDGRRIHDPDSLDFLRNDEGLYDMCKCFGWNLSVQQKFLEKHDLHDARIAALHDSSEANASKISALETEITNLRSKLETIKLNIQKGGETID